MVAFDGRLKSGCVKINSPNAASTPSPLPNVDHQTVNEPSTKILLTPRLHNNGQTKLLIKTDSQSRKIGLNVNTNVHLKSKKRYDCHRLLHEVLLLILTVYGILSYFEIQTLKCEIQAMKLQLKRMEDPVQSNLEIMSNIVRAIEQDQEEKLKMKVTNGISEHSITKRSADNADERASMNCSSSARVARDVTRGKHSHCRNRNGCHSRCLRTSGPLALHLKGAMPEITVRDGGIIAPWYVDKSSSGSFILAEGIIGERKGILEIFEEGLYYIYAQIYYLTSSSLNSYAINVQLGEGGYRGRDAEDSVIAVCSAEAAASKLSELSCFTATVRYLRRGDRLYVTQRERNRRIIFRDNQSFLGLVLLNSHHPVNNKKK